MNKLSGASNIFGLLQCNVCRERDGMNALKQ